jgi:CRP-like cAMP-binding protein
MPDVSRAFSANRILAKLSPAGRRTMASRLKPISLSLGVVLNEPEARTTYTYFPIDCMVSLVAVTEGRSNLEVGLVGREGMVGVALALGVEESPVQAIVQGKGTAIRIPSSAFAEALKKNAALRAAAHRFAYESMAMAMLIAACNNKHALESRLARWLLMTRDRLSTTTFEMTQQFLGQMLGVTRPSVSLVATELQRRGLISYRRGVVKLLDLKGLDTAACSCYGKIRRLSE